MDEDLREQIALFRYGVISELVSRPLAAGEKEMLLAGIAAKSWVIPGSERTHIGRATARDWVTLYQRHGLEGLRPSPRSDAGRPRAIPRGMFGEPIGLSRIQACVLSIRPLSHSSGASG